MKLFFDPIKTPPQPAKPLDRCVAQDMQLEELLHNFIADREMEGSVYDVVMDFCSDGDIIRYRQNILGDLIYSDDVYGMFTALKDNLFELKILFEMEMFKQIPEMKSMKTFLVTEKFVDIYTALLGRAKAANNSSLSAETKKIIEDICDATRVAELDTIRKDLEGLRESLKELERIRFNRFFSRGQNIENSIIPATKEKSVTTDIAELAKCMGLDVTEAEACALQASREMTRPVFIALYNEYHHIFEQIDAFHDKYNSTFDIEWINVIPKLNAILGFAIMYRRLRERGFAIAKATQAPLTNVNGLYSFFLVDKGLTPAQVVSNDYVCTDDTSFFFIMGPNAGGKTIFLSSVGLCQLFFQACGFVPASRAQIKIMKRMFTHFPVEEYNDNSGRLVEEQGRVEKIFGDVTDGECLALFNETYSSTKADIAYKLSVELCEKARATRLSGIFVTHLHSLKDYARETVCRAPHIGALTAMKDKRTGARTYKIVPMSDQNSSFAKDILEKYDMTVEQIFDRIQTKQKEDKAHVS